MMAPDVQTGVTTKTQARQHEQNRKLLWRFTGEGWPQAILVSGPQTAAKKQILLDAITESLWKKRKNDFYSRETTLKMIQAGEHPDFYQFSGARIKIGDKKNPEAGSVRHLLDKFLVYSSKFSDIRFIYFEDAAAILSEAESALLKSLEEAPPQTHFILSVEEPRQLKDTIVSRCIEIPLSLRPDPKQTPVDPWEKFWFFSEYEGTPAYNLMKETRWLDHMKDCYDRLSFNATDFVVFESLGWIDLRKKFKNEDQETQNLVLKLSFLPLYLAIRDRAINGKVPEMGAISLPAFSEKKLIYLGNLLEHFFRRLNVRYFNTRHPAMNVVFFSFLSRLMNAWVR